MSRLIKRNAVLLRALFHAKPGQRKHILAQSPDSLVKALCEIALNLVKGNIPLTTCQLKKLKKQKNIFRLLADKKKSLKKKRAALRQKGGFIFPLLATLAPVFGSLISGLIKKD